MKKEPQDPGIKDYWQATDVVSRPMAIAMTLLIMFICLAVIFSLFMGGRWLYNSLNGKKNQPATVSEKSNNGGITDVGQSGTSTASNTGNAKISASPTPIPSNSPKPSPTTTANSSNTANLPGTGPSELPNTGPVPE